MLRVKCLRILGSHEDIHLILLRNGVQENQKVEHHDMEQIIVFGIKKDD